jgi:CopG family nickel-responsive transcriptional regulator
MPGDLVDDLDELVRDKGFATRSQGVADLVRAGLAEHRAQQGNRKIAGTITLVYDHHKRNIQALLTEIQHDHAEVIISTLHIHLDQGNCMEILAVRGRADRVRDTANRLITAKGVKHGTLTVTVTESGDEGADADARHHRRSPHAHG